MTRQSHRLRGVASKLATFLSRGPGPKTDTYRADKHRPRPGHRPGGLRRRGGGRLPDALLPGLAERRAELAQAPDPHRRPGRLGRHRGRPGEHRRRRRPRQQRGRGHHRELPRHDQGWPGEVPQRQPDGRPAREPDHRQGHGAARQRRQHRQRVVAGLHGRAAGAHGVRRVQGRGGQRLTRDGARTGKARHPRQLRQPHCGAHRHGQAVARPRPGRANARQDPLEQICRGERGCGHNSVPPQ